MPEPPHSIRRQYLEVEVAGSETAALEVQRELPGLCSRVLAPAIASAFDCCISAGEYLRIDRLEVDVGTVAWSRMEQDLASAVQLALERAVREELALAGSGAPHTGLNAGQPGARHASHGQVLDGTLAYFLENGSLPPAFHLVPTTRLEAALLAAWMDAPAHGAADRVRLVAALRRPVAGERLVRQFSAGFLQALAARLASLDQQALARAFAIVRDAGGAPGEAKLLERQCWGAVFEGLAAEPTLPLTQLEGTVAAIVDAWKRARAQHAAGACASSRRTDAPSSSRGPVLARHAPNTAFAAPAHPDAGEGIFVNDAGLVLLHPFLGRLFEGLGLADGERLLQPDRALHLLHLLCSGREPAPEYALMLPKVLCNVPLTLPPAPDIALTDAEKEEAAALLGAVIGHWEVLRNTGADGLRSAFLLRHGKLSERDGDWLLQVETDTVDILLDQLPWGIGTVKLPWMDRILWVEWR